jgi:AcrR family transcriptional regulator
MMPQQHQDPSSERSPLDSAAIVAAAIKIADTDGVKGVTMRKVAERLGYKVMALYNHVANKDELLAAMVDAVADNIVEPPSELAPLEAIRVHAISTRESYVRHPWAPVLWLSHMPGPARTAQMEWLLRTLANSGLSPELAHHGFHAVNNHVLGYTLQEQAMALDAIDLGDPEAAARQYIDGLSEADHPHTLAHVHQHLDGETESSFELVLDLILDGLARLNESRA